MKENIVPISLFGENPYRVARELLGRFIEVKNQDDEIRRALITHVATFETPNPRMPSEMGYLPSGIALVSRCFRWGHPQIHISTGNGKGEHITLRGGVIENGEGYVTTTLPGNLAKALGVEKESDMPEYISFRRVNRVPIKIVGDSVEESQVKVETMTSNYRKTHIFYTLFE